MLALKLKTLIKTIWLGPIYNLLATASFLYVYLKYSALIKAKIYINILVFLASRGLPSSNTQSTDLILTTFWPNSKNLVKDLNFIITVLRREASTLKGLLIAI
jgi:hypothetical protein